MKYRERWFTPPKSDEIPIDLSDPGICTISGLFRQDITVNGTLRGTVTYIPENFRQNNRAIVAAIPSGSEPDLFLESSGLGELADKYGLLITMPEQEEYRWERAKDAALLNAVYKKLQAKDYYVVMQDAIYLMGFGDGADIAQEAARTMTSEWSGLATFGNFQDDLFMDTSSCTVDDADSQIGEMYISAKRAQLPVWMLIESETAAEKRLIDYWNRENQTQAEPVFGADGTLIFLPSNLKKTWKTNDDNISQTRVTKGFGMEDLSSELLEKVWLYVGAARRHRGYGDKILRYFRAPLENGATYHRVTVDGFGREWYEYVPARVAAEGKPVPLVCAFHGRGSNGETFFDVTDMSLVAEERGFIALFPTADIYQIREKGFRGVRLWNGNWNGKKLDSLPFIREMIRDVRSRLPVDPERIYACGQSSGGFMAATCALGAGDLFAAVAPWSGYTCPRLEGDFRYLKDRWFEGGPVPIQLMVGKKDREFGLNSVYPLGGESRLEIFIRFILEEYRLDPVPKQYSCPPVDYTVWENRDHVPMLTVGLVNDMPHANYPEESWISYDQFLCKFRMSEHGVRYYMGRPI